MAKYKETAKETGAFITVDYRKGVIIENEKPSLTDITQFVEAVLEIAKNSGNSKAITAAEELLKNVKLIGSTGRPWPRTGSFPNRIMLFCKIRLPNLAFRMI